MWRGESSLSVFQAETTYNIIFFSSFQEEKEYDIVVCATGRKVPLEGFERRSMEAQVGNIHALDRTLKHVLLWIKYSVMESFSNS